MASPRSAHGFGRRFAVALCLALVMGGVAARGRADGTLDRVVAVVGAGAGVRVILQSDVELRVWLERLRGGQGDLVSPPSEKELLAAEDALLGEFLIESEASRVQLPPPSRAAVDEDHQRLVEALGGATRVREMLASRGVERGELEAVARRRAVVGAFLSTNLEGTTDVTEAELAQAFESLEHPFRGRTYEETREVFRAWLKQRSLDRAVQRWVAVLEGRIPVRWVGGRGGGKATQGKSSGKPRTW